MLGNICFTLIYVPVDDTSMWKIFTILKLPPHFKMGQKAFLRESSSEHINIR